MSQEGGRLSRVLLVRLQEPGILTLSLPAPRARVDRVPSHHDEVPELRKRVLPAAVTGPRTANAPHRPEPGLVHRQQHEDAEPEREEHDGHGHRVRLVEVADPHDDRGVQVRVVPGLPALARGPGLDIEVAAASGVAEGLGAPRTESLAAHRAPRSRPLTLHHSLLAPNQAVCSSQLAELGRRQARSKALVGIGKMQICLVPGQNP